MQTVAAEAVLNVVSRSRARDVELPRYDGIPGTRWSRDVLDRAWHAALARGTTPFDLANETQLADWGLFGFVVQTASTAQQAVRAAAEFLPLITQRGQLDLLDEGVSQANWRTSSPTSDEDHAAIVSTLAHFVVCVQSVAGPDAVRSVSLMDRSFGATDWFDSRRISVSFNASCPAIVFGDLTARPSHAHPLLFEHLHAEASTRLKALTLCQSDQVRQLVSQQPQLRPADIARTMAMSQRSLRRLLAAEGTSLSELTAQQQAAEACSLLQRGQSVSEVSDHLGFSDPSAFARAFRRWKGTSPSQYATTHARGRSR